MITGSVVSAGPDLITGLQAQIASLEERLASLERTQKETSNNVSIIVSNNDFDRLMPALILATGAVSMSMNAHLFFTFWGTCALKKKNLYEGKNFIEKMMTFMMPGNIDDVKLSKMHMMGAGKILFESLMKKHNISSLPELLEMSVSSGVRICACEMTMSLMGIQREELIDGLEYGGVAKYLECASQSQITLFI